MTAFSSYFFGQLPSAKCVNFLIEDDGQFRPNALAIRNAKARGKGENEHAAGLNTSWVDLPEHCTQVTKVQTSLSSSPTEESKIEIPELSCLIIMQVNPFFVPMFCSCWQSAAFLALFCSSLTYRKSFLSARHGDFCSRKHEKEKRSDGLKGGSERRRSQRDPG